MMCATLDSMQEQVVGMRKSRQQALTWIQETWIQGSGDQHVLSNACNDLCT